MKKTILLFTVAILFLFALCANAVDDNADNANIADEVIKEIQFLQGYNFKTIPSVKEIEAGEAGDHIAAFQARYGDDKERISKTEKLWKFLRLIPANYNLGEELAKIRAGQRRSFYDPVSNTIYIEKNVPTPALDNPLIQRASEQLELGEREYIIAHDVSYALMDQQFNIFNEGKGPSQNESADSLTAWNSVIDGRESSLIMDFLVRNTGLNVLMFPKPESVIKQFISLVSYYDRKLLEAAPPAIREWLEFTYVRGTAFIFYQRKSGGYLLADSAYRSRPLSTEQIIHPEKFFVQRDNPIEIKLPELSDIVNDTPGAQPPMQDTMGELGLKLFLEGLLENKDEAARAAAGWGGDRVALYDAGDGNSTAVFFTTWDTPEAALRFNDAIVKAGDKFTVSGAGFSAKQIGRDVAFIISSIKEIKPELMERLWESEKIPVVSPPPVPEKPQPESVLSDINSFLNMFTTPASKPPPDDDTWKVEGNVYENLQHRYQITRPNKDWNFERVHISSMFLSEFTALNTKEPGASFSVFTFRKYGPEVPNPVDEMVSFMAMQMANFSKQDDERFEVAGMPARSVTFSGVVFMPITITYTEVQAPDFTYIMTFWSMQSSYKKLLPEFEALRDSIKILPTESN